MLQKEKEKLIVPGAGHGEAEKIDSNTYWNTVWSSWEDIFKHN